jgi:GAF domain-containing protein
MDIINKLELMKELRDDQRFYDAVMTAAFVSKTPIAFFSIIAGNRKYIKSSFGLFPEGEKSPDFLVASSMPIEDSICGATLHMSPNLPLLIPSLSKSRFKDKNFLSLYPNIEFYCGLPVSFEGVNIGAFCVADSHARTLSPVDLANLHIMRDQIHATLQTRAERIAKKKLFKVF